MPSHPVPARIESLIGWAEVELAAHKVRLKHEGRSAEPSDPFDQVECLKLWLAALHSCKPLRSGGQTIYVDLSASGAFSLHGRGP